MLRSGFSPVERSAIRAVAQGTPTERVARLIGKAAPTGIVSAALSGGAGLTLGGGPGAAAMLGAGTAGRLLSNRITSQAAKRADTMMRAGRDAQQMYALPPPAASQMIEQAAPAALIGAGLPLAR